MSHEARVIRVAEDQARGTYDLQGRCSCGWRSPDTVRIRAKSDRIDAPATNELGRVVQRHVDENAGRLVSAPTWTPATPAVPAAPAPRPGVGSSSTTPAVPATPAHPGKSHT